jgi:hypothetical protein
MLPWWTVVTPRKMTGHLFSLASHLLSLKEETVYETTTLKHESKLFITITRSILYDQA